MSGDDPLQKRYIIRVGKQVAELVRLIHILESVRFKLAEIAQEVLSEYKRQLAICPPHNMGFPNELVVHRVLRRDNRRARRDHQSSWTDLLSATQEVECRGLATLEAGHKNDPELVFVHLPPDRAQRCTGFRRNRAQRKCLVDKSDEFVAPLFIRSCIHLRFSLL